MITKRASVFSGLNAPLRRRLYQSDKVLQNDILSRVTSWNVISNLKDLRDLARKIRVDSKGLIANIPTRVGLYLSENYAMLAIEVYSRTSFSVNE